MRCRRLDEPVAGLVQHLALVPPVHVQTEQVEGAVVEAEVSAYAVKRLARREGATLYVDSLYRASIEVVGPQLQICMIVRTSGTRRLNFVAVGCVPLQVK